MAKTTFKVLKAKTINNDSDKKSYYQVGTAVIRDDGKNGVLFLNMFDGDFLLKPKKADEKDEVAETSE